MTNEKHSQEPLGYPSSMADGMGSLRIPASPRPRVFASPRPCMMSGASNGQPGRTGNEDYPREVDWLLINADWLVTGNRVMQCIANGALAIEGDTLLAVGPTSDIRPRFRGLREMDLRGFMVIPGLVNTHTHGAMSCLRGLGNDLPLQRWLHEVIFPAEAAHVSPRFVYWGTLLAAVEMLLNGVTTFCDGYFFEEAAAQAVLHSGARAILGQGILDFPTPDQPVPSRSRERAQAFLQAFPSGQSRLRPALFCHAPYTCSAETLQWVKNLCREHDMLFQTHLSETAAEVEDLVQKLGERPVLYLDRLGILDAKTLCAHGVWLDAGEIEILAARRSGISHNVESNMKLASGIAPLPELLAAGVRVGLGTDSCASNNDLDLFSEMDKAAKLHKVIRNDPVVCTAAQMFRLATLEGAMVLGWADAIGSLEVGKKADLAAIDLNQPHLTPLYDPISHLVYAVKGSDVRHVWVDGRQVVAEGRVTGIDVARLCSEVRRIAREVASAQNRKIRYGPQ